MNPKLKLVSLNIEGHLHLDKVLPFLLAERPDVICLQEVFESEMALLEDKLNMAGVFAPHAFKPLLDRQATIYGIAVFAKKIINVKADYYYGSRDRVQLYRHPDQSTHMRTLLHADFPKDGKTYHIGTTHFTWTPNGQANDDQRRDLKSLLKLLAGIPSIIFCGDLNAPRGREVFSEIAKYYTDNIPRKYKTSLDKDYHRNGALRLMVDALFSTPDYLVDNVRLASGVSDHMAIVAEIGVN